MNRDKQSLTPPLDPAVGMSPASFDPDPAAKPLVARNPDGGDGSGQGEGAPEYSLTVPAELAEMGIQPDTEHPLYKSAAAWAKQRALSQHDFDELTAGFYRSLAEDAERDRDAEQVERKSFIDAFAPASMQGRDDEEALQFMNDSPYGLTASIWSEDVEAAAEIGDRIETGTVFMNRCDYLDPALCWTGCKDTGRGVGLSKLAYQSLTRPKSYHLRNI